MFWKKVSHDTLLKALEQKKLKPVFKFMKENKKCITDHKNGEKPLGNLPIPFLEFLIIIDEIQNFPSSDFKMYIDFCEDLKVPESNMKISDSNTILFQCMLFGKLEHVSILLESKFFPFSEWRVWKDLLEAQRYIDERGISNMFHLYMEKGADLNQTFSNTTVFEFLIHQFPKDFIQELKHYFHTLNGYNQNIYKQNRLRYLF